MSNAIHIGVDIQAGRGTQSGLGVYTESLAYHLQKAPHNGLHFYFYERKTQEDLNTVGRWIWENIEVPRLAWRSRVQILHVPAFAQPLVRSFKLVVTVHDLIGRAFPNQISLPK